VADLSVAPRDGTHAAAGPAKGKWAGWARHRWHELDANRFPPWSRFDNELGRLIREWVVPGHAPPAGTLTSADTVVTLGSCFALELRDYLGRVGVPTNMFVFPSGLNNTFAILDFISLVVTGEETGRAFRYDRDDQGDIRPWKTSVGQRERSLAGVREAGAFVFTLGLAEVWEDRKTGGVFWRGVPEEIFDAGRHAFRLSTVEENEANLVEIVELIRSENPTAPILLTLSPVPLAATFREISCMTADCVSKSVLRVALDRVMSRELEGVYYWPSFEIVRWCGAHLPWRSYGLDDRNPRHVSRYLVAEIIDAFVESFYTPAAAAELSGRRGREVPPPWSLAGRLRAASSQQAIRRLRSLPARAGARARLALHL
jgi:GSCFA family